MLSPFRYHAFIQRQNKETQQAAKEAYFEKRYDLLANTVKREAEGKIKEAEDC